MSNNEWITDRLPNDLLVNGGAQVFVTRENKAIVEYAYNVKPGEPWRHINIPFPYVKPKRYMVLKKDWRAWVVHDTVTQCDLATDIYSPIAAERIAAIYEEVRP